MTTTPVRTIVHVCDLPRLPGDQHNRNVLRCDECGRYWKASILPHFEWAAEWLPVGRFEAWCVQRRVRKEKKARD